MREKNIYTQGRFDGACFLYSIANCYVALTGKHLKQKEWDNLVINAPLLHDFMCGNIGTINYTDSMYFNALNNTLNSISVKHEFIIEETSIDTIYNSINNKSVIISAIKGNTERQKELDHWVCCVGTQGKSILIACSWADYGYNDENEKQDQVTLRWYNDKITNKSVIVQNCIYAIRHIVH